MEMKKYLTREAYYDGEKYRFTGTTVKIGKNDPDNVYLLIDYTTDKDHGFHGWNIITDYNLYVEIKDLDQIKVLYETISQWLEIDDDLTLREELGSVSGEYTEHEHYVITDESEKSQSKIDSLEVVVRADGVNLICRESEEYVDDVHIPGSTEERNNEDLDTDNIREFLELLDDFLAYCDGPTEHEKLPKIIEGKVENQLKSSQYGAEVIEHVEEGDQCFGQELFTPALGSYIHAIEWSIISYLKQNNNVDIIQREQNGQLYYFTGGQNNLLDELTSHVNIDQKTISQLESMNRSERRWMAHHKSGTTLPDEVKAVRARLGELLQTLYS